MHWTRVLTLCFSLAQPRPHMHVRGRARKVLTSGTRVGRGGCSLQLAPAHATYMSPTSRSQCTVGMLSIGRGVGGGKEGAFRHSWQRGWLAAWLRHPRKNRSRSSATPARLSLLGGQLRMLMRRGTVSIVAMHERSMLTCRDQQHPSTAHCPAHLVPLPWRRLRGHQRAPAAARCLSGNT